MEHPLPVKDEIFLVEDDEDLAALLRFIFEKEGLKVRNETDGIRAIDLLTGPYRPTLVVLDLMLPGVDGYQVLKALRAREDTKDIPIIVVSAKVSEKEITTAIEYGATDYITKPFNVSDLVERVKKNLQEKNSL